MKNITDLFKKKKVGFIGLGKSNISLSNFLINYSSEIFITEKRSYDEVEQEIKFLDKKINYELGGHSDKILDYDVVIKSPGIPNSAEIIQKIKSANIPIFNELEISYQFIVDKLKKIPKIIAVTGTNGKTTTTTLIGKICSSHFEHVFVGGNIGIPIIEYYDKITPESILVVEVSSYQLEDIIDFKPHISCLLNITPDHLDHHGSMENYISSKLKIFLNQTAEDYAVLNYDDKTVYRTNLKSFLSKKVYFSKETRLVEGCYWLEKSKKIIFVNSNFDEITLSLQINLPGSHNVENVLASVTSALLLGIPKEKIEKTVSEFNGVEHRLEFVRLLDGVTYINDSKATNVESTIVALKSFSQPIHLILGGRDKGFPYTPLIPLINSKVKTIFLIGEAEEKIFSQLKGVNAKIYRCHTLEQAVMKSKSVAKKGEIVLLSPACSSFDQFKNFEHRGEIFKQLVNKL